MFNIEFIKIYNDYYFKRQPISKILNRLKEIQDSYGNNALHYVIFSQDLSLFHEIIKEIKKKS